MTILSVGPRDCVHIIVYMSYPTRCITFGLQLIKGVECAAKCLTVSLILFNDHFHNSQIVLMSSAVTPLHKW